MRSPYQTKLFRRVNARYQRLVDKRFAQGLTPKETLREGDLGRRLDEFDNQYCLRVSIPYWRRTGQHELADHMEAFCKSREGDRVTDGE